MQRRKFFQKMQDRKWLHGVQGTGTEAWGGGGSQHPHPLWDQTGITLLSGTQKASPMVPVIVHLAFQQFLRTSCVQALPGHWRC